MSITTYASNRIAFRQICVNGAMCFQVISVLWKQVKDKIDQHAHDAHQVISPFCARDRLSIDKPLRRVLGDLKQAYDQALLSLMRTFNLNPSHEAEIFCGVLLPRNRALR